ncbi:Hypp1736 [Branchiostoma lanceolatum]|uniref:Hypp1736 protein n=1 Tax=Branchiostoma lanceolatum TaxID=7740 RepID=A0A8J9ZK19_BRALA|nr:Hypp1736 [Branchiostoma lanceolatum]
MKNRATVMVESSPPRVLYTGALPLAMKTTLVLLLVVLVISTVMMTTESCGTGSGEGGGEGPPPFPERRSVKEWLANRQAEDGGRQEGADNDVPS